MSQKVDDLKRDIRRKEQRYKDVIDNTKESVNRTSKRTNLSREERKRLMKADLDAARAEVKII